MKKFFIALISAFFLLSPNTIAKITFPPLTGHVVDEAGVLSAQTKSTLNKLLSSDTNNQVVVAILKDLQGIDGREYGIELARHWQLGQKGKDNGVLLLLATKDRYVGIEVGYGLEDVLTDSISGRILQYKVLPFLQNNDYNQAMLNGATAIMTVINNGNIKDIPEDNDLSPEDIISLLFTLFMIYLILKGKGPRGGGGIFLGGNRSGFGGGFFGGGGSFGGGGAGRRF